MLPNMMTNKSDATQDIKITMLNKKIDKLSKIVENQRSIINELRKDIKKLLGVSFIETKSGKVSNYKDSSHDFSSEFSEESSPKSKMTK